MAITLNGTTGVTTTGLTSNGIDDNATSTAMTLDTSGNVLVGKTSASSTTAGFQASQDGQTAINRSGTALQVGRLSTDGSIIDLRKNGTTVGSIGVQSTDQLYIGTPDGNGVGIVFDGDNRKIDPTNGSGSNLDAAVDLGNGSHRFKDLYLSGGVYLGGVGAANKLDDYEEGNWTPVIRAGSETGTIVGTTNVFARYTKIGRPCNFTLNITRSDTASLTGNRVVTGLPFTGVNTNGVAAGSFWLDNAASDYVGVLYIPPENTFFRLKDAAGPNDYTQIQEFENGRAVYLSATYTTT